MKKRILQLLQKGQRTINKIQESKDKQAYYIMVGLTAGAVSGLGLKMFSVEVFCLLEEGIIDPIIVIFMKALGMMVAPVIFFAVIAGITNLSETADVGKLGGRLAWQSAVLMLLVAALSTGLALLFFRDNLPSLALLFENPGDEIAGTNFSFKNIVMDIVPGNLVEPFKGDNLLQILFLSVFFGLVLNRLKEKAHLAKEIIELMNGFCAEVMDILARCIPFIVFLSLTELFFRLDMEMALTFGKVIMGNVLAIPLCLGLFAVLLAIWGRISPWEYLKKMTAFAPVPLATSSSNAALPQTIRLATEKLGVAPELASFSLPVGIQLHQAGTCFFLALPAMMMARVYSMPVTSDFLGCLFLSVFVMAYTMPPVPGAGVICLGSVFAAIGVPVSDVAFFLCIDPLIDMLNTVANVFCNVFSTILVAQKNDMWDEDVYRKL